MTESVDDFLARADDVLTGWHGSDDAMRWHPDGPDAIDDTASGYALPNLTGLRNRAADITVIVEDEAYGVADEAYGLIAALRELAACECDECTAWRARTPLGRSAVIGMNAAGRSVGIDLDWEHQRLTGQDPRNAGRAGKTGDPRQRALDARRNRNTGPRDPYRLDGRRR